ncbi:DUF1002 domain-containing protein [Fundicoccus sp. Sow4_H7]|uniref:DUF1002 domain-containing protein n=1 Tax=Fundicoccus sp. Sow4_H7 TaxID=3438784 RepID=UPI003F90E047
MTKKIFVRIAVGSLLFSTISYPVIMNVPHALAVTNEQTTIQREGKMSLGASLNAEQATMTQQLLGAKDITAENTIRVDGNMVNHYLNDGSDANTGVFSSAYIQPQAEGFGVRVQIVTPQNITLVSATTYQNAAITAGAKDVLLRIATVTEVTGEGALAGVYALLEESGTALQAKDIQVANKEIKIIDSIKNNTAISDYSTNQFITDVKINIINQINQNVEINEQELNLIIINQLQEHQIDASVSNELLTELMDFARDFSQTEAAQNEDTIKQLELSVVGSNWPEILASQEGSFTVEDALNLEKPDYSDTNIYHPIIQALLDETYALMQKDGDLHNIYSHTFIVETLMPQLSQAELEGLNYIRTLIYQLTAHSDAKRQEAASQQSADKASYKSYLTYYLNQAAQIQQEPSFNEIIQRISAATGLASEAYSIADVIQDGRIVTVNFIESWLVPETLIGSYQINLDTLEVTDLATQEILPLVYNFEEHYGVAVENYAIEAPIPEEYTVPTSESLEAYEVPIIIDENSDVTTVEEEPSEQPETVIEEEASAETIEESVEEPVEELPSEESIEDVPSESEVVEESTEESIEEESLVEETVEEEVITDESTEEIIEETVEESIEESVEETVEEETEIAIVLPDFYQSWSDILNGMTTEAVVDNETILSSNWGDYSDTQVYHPVIQAMYNRFFEKVSLNDLTQDLLSHTFVLEEMQANLSPDEKAAINQLRWLNFQYELNTWEASRQPAFEQGMSNLRDESLRRINHYQEAKSDANVREIISLISRTTGVNPQAYAVEYGVNEMNPSYFDLFYWIDNMPAGELPSFTYDYLNEFVGYRPIGVDAEGNLFSVEPIEPFSFASIYGVEVMDEYQASQPIEYPIELQEMLQEETTEEVVE